MRIHLKTFIKKFTPIKDSFPKGLVLFTGEQGMGKTISAVFYIRTLKEKYPDLIVYSTIQFNADYATIVTIPELEKILLTRDKDRKPIAFLIDEIQNVLFSKSSKINQQVVMSITQQRKARKTIVGTLQEFLDLDTRYRRQLRAVVRVKRIGRVIYETWLNPETLSFDNDARRYTGKGTHEIWKLHDETAQMYDTFEIVSQSLEFDSSKLKGSAPT
ncbi:hypothetical protein EPN95_01215 [Patescibacteria group bacterium]|nr:MAG: hypothetical protein EPN95_01215 [Patescibacteria group bacterium]